MDEIKDGAELLITYGPYAVLALFALLIAPHLTKQCLKIAGKGFNKKLTGSIAIGAWLVVLSMVAYITIAWTPNMVYLGKIGKLTPEMTVFSDAPSSVDLFIKNDGDVGGKNSWNYALITNQRINNKNECAAFTINWTTNDQTHAVDFEVPIKVLIAGKNLKMKIKDQNTEGDVYEVYIYRDGAWSTKGTCEENTVAINTGFIKTAYAADSENLKKISTGLQSNNSATRSKARKEMRRLNKDELSQLRDMVPSGSNAQKVVDKEQARR